MEDEEISKIRLELHGSMKSQFILGLEDRLLTPLLFALPLSFLLKTWAILILFSTIFLLKVVLKYALNLTGREFVDLVWTSIAHKPIKPVKN